MAKPRTARTTVPAKGYKGSFVISFRVPKGTLQKAVKHTHGTCSVHAFAREVFETYLDPKVQRAA